MKFALMYLTCRVEVFQGEVLQSFKWSVKKYVFFSYPSDFLLLEICSLFISIMKWKDKFLYITKKNLYIKYIVNTAKHGNLGRAYLLRRASFPKLHYKCKWFNHWLFLPLTFLGNTEFTLISTFSPNSFYHFYWSLNMIW